MTAPHTVALLAYDGCDLLDVTGPAAVFAAANRVARRTAYNIELISPNGGLITTLANVSLQTRALADVQGIDTFLIAGGERPALQTITTSPSVRRWVRRSAATCQRFGSVCTGVFVLAAFGLIDRKRVATHWATCDQLASRFPEASVDPDAMYAIDGKLWTSAGVTTGIDMALAMVERDLGVEIANNVAKLLILYVRRPGYQSQFSPLLQTQMRAGAPFAELICWIHTHLDERLDVPALAAQARLSERSFHRKFVDATGQTPARFVQTLRLDAARMLLAHSGELKTVAAKVGLQPTARFVAAFQRRFGVTPKLFREMHAAP